MRADRAFLTKRHVRRISRHGDICWNRRHHDSRELNVSNTCQTLILCIYINISTYLLIICIYMWTGMPFSFWGNQESRPEARTPRAPHPIIRNRHDTVDLQCTEDRGIEKHSPKSSSRAKLNCNPLHRTPDSSAF